MFEMRHEPGSDGGITAPIIVCDFCEEEITECRAANLLWLHENPGQQYHTHKTCNRQLEQRLVASYGKPIFFSPGCLSIDSSITSAITPDSPGHTKRVRLTIPYWH